MASEPIVSLPLEIVGLLILGLFALAGYVGGSLVRRQARDPRRARAEWFSAVIDAFPEAALVTSSSGQVLLCNRIAQDRLGVSRGERAQGQLAVLVKRAGSGSPPEVAEFSLEGDRRRYRAQATPILRATDSPWVLLVVTSVANHRAGDDAFLSWVGPLAHELRTPLTAIMGHVDILGSTGPDEEELRRKSQTFISKEVSRLTRLVEDTLHLSRLETTPIITLPVNPTTIAEEAISSFYQQAEAKGIEIVLRSAVNLPIVVADRDRILQVLINLLDNAVKFSPAGGTVVVELSLVDGDVQYVVEDTGPGIAPQDLPYVFNPFFKGTLPDRSVRSGAGLGLTIVKRILDQHGSAIRVDSMQDKGARFSFALGSAGGGE